MTSPHDSRVEASIFMILIITMATTDLRIIISVQWLVHAVAVTEQFVKIFHWH